MKAYAVKLRITTLIYCNTKSFQISFSNNITFYVFVKVCLSNYEPKNGLLRILFMMTNFSKKPIKDLYILN